jgi:hypothetical protein
MAKLDAKTLTSGNDDKILELISEVFLNELSSNGQLLKSLKDAMKIFFEDIITMDSYNEALMHSIQQCMSWILENAVEAADLDGDDIWPDKWHQGRNGTLIFEIFDETKYRKVIQKVIDKIKDKHSKQILNIILEIKL